jgi:ABC-type multidrug transport system fused ATPase/permease subunit
VITHQPLQLQNQADEFVHMEAGKIVGRASHLQVTL